MSVLDTLIESIRMHMNTSINKYANIPQEVKDSLRDTFKVWVRACFDENRALLASFIQTAKQSDFDRLLNEVFTDANWKGNREAFFSVLHMYGVLHEMTGRLTSTDFAAFYRKRYNKAHVFASERTR